MPKNRKLQNIIGTEHITDAAEAAIAAQASGGATVAFKNVAVSGQDNVVADTETDTLTLVGGSNVTITTDASADSVTINAAGGSPGGSDGQIQYNNGGSFGGSSLVYTDTTNAEQFKIDVSSSETPFVIVQEGAGNAFEVHDTTDPDNNRFQISNSGNVTIKGLNGGGWGQALYVAGHTISNTYRAETATSATTPSFSSAYDTNTGVFFPATDTLGFSTGGTERLRVGSSGEVLIGGTAAGSSGQVLTSGGSGAAVSWASAGGGAIASIQDLKPQIDSSMLVSGGDYQKTLGGAPFFLNLASWSTIQWGDTDDYPTTNNGNVVFFPYMGSGETMVKARVYKVSNSGQNNDTKIMFAFYASDSDGLPTGSPVNSGSVSIDNPQATGASVLEGTWSNGPTLTAGELYWLGLTRDAASGVAQTDGSQLNMGSIRATPNFEQEALGFSSSSLLLNDSNFGRVTALTSSTGTGTTNGSRAFPTIGSGTVSLATSSGKNVPRASFEVTYS